ncbi:MAG: response regulator transcription factor [Solirubrobacteraceae bacterium]|nr:response regulator transcription factor [Solirubrobacteraceae bacterium]
MRRHYDKLRVLIVDDHEVVHWGLRALLSSQDWVERCLVASTAETALEMTERYEPHVALVDLFLGDASGAELCREVRKRSPITNVLLFSGSGRMSAAAARAAGASGFVSKGLGARDVMSAIRVIGLGGQVFGEDATAAEEAQPLTEREREVLALVATGATNREIAAQLHLSPHTVKDYTRNVFRKLEVRNRAEAVQRAQRLGLLA